MNANGALRGLADVTAGQWGMVTTAQASALGVTRLVLSRLTEAGHFERLAHGVYKDAGAPDGEFDALRAAWLSTEPKRFAEDRVSDAAEGVVVASTSAAFLHGVGDSWASRHEFVAPVRRQSQREEIRFRQRTLEDRDITLVRGLPVMRIERTLADLLEELGDQSLVADALRTAMKHLTVDLDRLRELLSPLAERNGCTKKDGAALLSKLTESAGLDLNSVARRISANPDLAARVVAEYLQTVLPSGHGEKLRGVITETQLPALAAADTLAKALQEAVCSQLDTVSNMLPSAESLDLAHSAVEEVNAQTLASLSQQWAKRVTLPSGLGTLSGVAERVDSKGPDGATE